MSEPRRGGARAPKSRPSSRAQPRQTVNRRLFAGRVAAVIASLLLALNSGVEALTPLGQSPTVSIGQPADARFSRTCTPIPPYSRALTALVENDLGAMRGRYAVAIRDLDSGESYMLSGERRMPAGSVYKLAVLYTAWREILLGNLSRETLITISREDAAESEPADGLTVGETITVEAALDRMVRVSSNAASHALLRTLGRENINTAMLALGLPETLLPTAVTRTGVTDALGEEVATTSARDMLCYLTRAARGELLGPEPSARTRRLLFLTPDGDRIPVLLPPNTPVAHKTGEIPGVRNDVGIVYAPRATYVLVVLGQSADEGEAMATIARLSRKVYDHFNR